MNLDTLSKFSPKTIMLHWLVALFMLSLLSSGVYMAENKAYAFYDWHKSFGLLVFIFAAWRVSWRLRNGWPIPVGNASALMHGIAKLVHLLLLVGTIMMPISGFMMSSMGGYGVSFFGLELVAHNPDPLDPSKMIALNGTLAGIAHNMHHWAGNLIILAVVLHVLGAFKHHLIDKDGTLRRMLGKEV